MDKTDVNIQENWINFQQGNKEAFALLYNSYVDILFRYGTKICIDEGLVKDAIQEIFLDLFLKRKKNKSNPSNIKFYLILALKRNLIKKIKVNRKLIEMELSHELLFEPIYSTEKTTIEKEEDIEKNRLVSSILDALPSKQKEAVFLRYNECLEYAEIAQLLRISVESVRKQVYRALKSVRETYNKDSIIFFMYFSKNK